MFELLQRVADEEPDRVAILTSAGATSYRQVVEASLRVAEALRHEGITRFAVVDHEAEIIVPLLAGAALAGVEACQYPPVEIEEILDLIGRFNHDVLVTDRVDLGSAATRVLSTQALLGADSLTAEFERDRGGSQPHLMLTTGTTGAPRGVCHDWTRLLRGTSHIKPGSGERWLLAYGLHQFAGLQLLFHVFAAGATLVAPAPRRPIEGLAAMRWFDVTHASATPTYWRFLLAEMRSDGGPVPKLQQITMGGEAIPGPLLSEIKTVFPTANISQIYAGSEFGSTGSMHDGRSGLSTDVLERDEDAPITMRIVNGELWIRSRTGMLGYYGEPPVEADAWRATGDLVEVVDDRILFQGRSSEIINVGGVKVHPLPIEERVSAVAGVDIARVYGRPNPMTGAIVALEVVAAPDADHKVVETAIRRACQDLSAASRPRSIRFVDSLTTVGGKIIRRPTGEH